MRIVSTTIILTSLSSSSKVNSFFLTCFSWLRKLNSAAFFWSLANLFSYFDTFFRVGFMLEWRETLYNKVVSSLCWWNSDENFETKLASFLSLLLQDKEKNTYNLPRRSLTWLFKSAICMHWIFLLTFVHLYSILQYTLFMRSFICVWVVLQTN